MVPVIYTTTGVAMGHRPEPLAESRGSDQPESNEFAFTLPTKPFYDCAHGLTLC
jgi:hypothetical protein